MKGLSMRQAINNMCKSCIYDKIDTGAWRMQVEACTSHDCALYPLRPISSSSTKIRAKESKI